MREWLNESTLFNTVAMYASESRALVLVVEGDDDYFVLSRHRSADLHMLAGVGGRENVLRAAHLAQARGLGEQVRFLVDRDLDAFVPGRVLEWPNVFVSDAHDLFMDLLIAQSSLVHLVIDSHSRGQRRGAKQKKRPPAPEASLILRDAINLAVLLSAVRITNERNGLGLNFDRFPFGNLQKSDFRVEALADIVTARSSYAGDRGAVLADSLAALEEVKHRPCEVVGDHDFFRALARTLKTHDISVSHETLLTSFIAGVSCAVVSATRCVARIESWCSKHGRVALDCAADRT